MSLEDSSDSDVSLQRVFSTSSLQHLTQMHYISLSNWQSLVSQGTWDNFSLRLLRMVSPCINYPFERQQHGLAPPPIRL